MTPIEKLFIERIFSYDALVLELSSALDYKVEHFLKMFYAIKNNQRKKTILYLPNDAYQCIQKKCRDDLVHDSRFENALNVLDNFGDIVQCPSNENGQINSTSFDAVSCLLANGFRVLLVTEVGNNYYKMKKRLGFAHVNAAQFGYIKLHDFIANDVRAVSDFAAKYEELREEKISYNLDDVREGNTLMDINGHPVLLTKQLSSGGEATCYIDNQNRVCKIFNEKSNTTTKRAKISHMLSYKKYFTDTNIAWPLGLLRDRNGNFVGYFMNRIENAKELLVLTCDVSDRNELLKNRKNAIILCISICTLFELLHEHYVVVGDINFRNILFDPNDFKASLIDLDSSQIDNYLCKVGFEDFVAPEQIDNDYRKIEIKYRTEQSELFLLARVLFQILFGDDPYACKGNGSQNLVEKYKKGKFPYPEKRKIDGGEYSLFDERSFTIYAWDNTPAFVREEFFNVFSKEYGKSYRSGSRPTAFAWKRIMVNYLHEIESLPKNAKPAMLYPNGFFGEEAPYNDCKGISPNSGNITEEKNAATKMKKTRDDATQKVINLELETAKEEAIKCAKKIKRKFNEKYSSKVSKQRLGKINGSFSHFIELISEAKTVEELSRIKNNLASFRTSFQPKEGSQKSNTSKNGVAQQNATRVVKTSQVRHKCRAPNSSNENVKSVKYEGLAERRIDVFWIVYFPTILSCVFFLALYSCSTVWWWMLIVDLLMSVGLIQFVNIEIEAKYNKYWDYDCLSCRRKHTIISIGIMFLNDALAIGIDYIFKRNIFLASFGTAVFSTLVILYFISSFFLKGTNREIRFRPYTINVVAGVAVAISASLSLIPSWEPRCFYNLAIHGLSVIAFVWLVVLYLVVNKDYKRYGYES